ncbi:MAG TPA: carbohydrate-binding family 9-like protein [Polyangium sp.]|nr:carbohydrate-binding family 9-like protein [Polyangium sp.]
MKRPEKLLFLVLGLGACTTPDRADEKKPRQTAPAQGVVVPDTRRVIKELSVPTLPAGQTITIDGKADEPAWEKAASTGDFVDVFTGAPNTRLPVQGSVRLLWDDTALYAAFDVKDYTIRGGFPADAVDPHLWERDTVEIMIDPDGDGDNKDYYEVQINPQNLVFDSQFDDYNQPRGGPTGPFGHQEWSAKLQSAVVLRGKIDDDVEKDEGYVVEAKIPWASFTKAGKVPPAPGTTWRMNFYAMENNGGAAWSPILGLGNFHKAIRFGRVKWQRDAAP